MSQPPDQHLGCTVTPFKAGFALGEADARNALAERGSGAAAIWQRRSHTDIPQDTASRLQFLSGYVSGMRAGIRDNPAPQPADLQVSGPPDWDTAGQALTVAYTQARQHLIAARLTIKNELQWTSEAIERVQARLDSHTLRDLSGAGEIRAHGPALDTAIGQAHDAAAMVTLLRTAMIAAGLDPQDDYYLAISE